MRRRWGRGGVRGRVAVVAVALALAVAASSCSDSGGGDGESADTTATSTTTSSTTTTTVPTTTTTTAPAGPPVAASDVAGLAAQATEAERAVRDPAVVGDALERAGWTQQVVSRTIAATPERLPAVVRLMPAEYRASLEANVQAAVELRALTKPAPALPGHWRIVAPAPAEELLGYYKEAGASVGVPWTLLASIHFVETKLGRIRGTSTAGAQGPMQFIPSTWRQYGGGGDINSNRDSIFAAARLLKNNGAPERIDDAVYSYNHSRRYVAAVKLYAGEMAKDERAFRAYYQWQVYYRMADGDRVLLEGYPDVPAIKT